MRAVQQDVPAIGLAHLLAANPVFAGMKRQALEEFSRSASLATYASGDAIFDEASPADHLYVLVSGVVRVFHRSTDGREVTVKHLAPPTTFGEMEILSGSHFLESTAALDDVCVVKITAGAFLELMAGESPVASTLLRDVCARFCVAARNEHSVFFEVPPRLASLVLSYADFFGRPTANGVRVGVPLTQEALADGLGIVVRSVSRVLADWRKQGWVTRSKGWLVIHNSDALEELAKGLRFNLNYRFKNLTNDGVERR